MYQYIVMGDNTIRKQYLWCIWIILTPFYGYWKYCDLISSPNTVVGGNPVKYIRITQEHINRKMKYNLHC